MTNRLGSGQSIGVGSDKPSNCQSASSVGSDEPSFALTIDSSVELPHAVSTFGSDEPSHETDDDDALVALSVEEKDADPLLGVSIVRTIDGLQYAGKVIDICRTKLTSEVLYLIGFADGDCEHLTASEVILAHPS